MASNRAAKSGIALEAQKKIESKWDPERAKIAIKWIGECIGQNLTTDGTPDDFHAILCSGQVLGKLANWIKPGCIPQSKLETEQKLAFKRMELIGLFLACIDEANGGPVKKSELFQTVDLYEKVNLPQVNTTIDACASAMLAQGKKGYGIVECKGQQREWTQEQLNAGKGIIGLQMGSNKGATQSGQNFGKSRDIMS